MKTLERKIFDIEISLDYWLKIKRIVEDIQDILKDIQQCTFSNQGVLVPDRDRPDELHFPIDGDTICGRIIKQELFDHFHDVTLGVMERGFIVVYENPFTAIGYEFKQVTIKRDN